MSAVIRIKMDDRLVAAGLAKAPEVIVRSVDEALSTAAKDTAEAMRAKLEQNGSLARSTLLLSVNIQKLAQMRYFVAPGVNYARMVEEGTGPAAGRASYMPDPRKLEDYIRIRHARLSRLRGRKGSVTRRQQIDEIRDRAWGLALHIKEHGTQPHPFVAPTRELMDPKIRVMAAAAVNKSLREIFSA